MLRPLARRVSRLFLGGVFLAAACGALLCGDLALGQVKTVELPLTKVVMFHSGVSYYARTGQVDGDARVDLKFNARDVNDLLKSLVLQDSGGGKIGVVNYSSKDPITKTLKTFSIDLTTNPTLAQLLAQVRGERVRITAPGEIEGVIVGVERRKQKIDDEVRERDFINLLTDGGLRSIALETVGTVKLLNKELDAELRKALLVLATQNSNDKKTVSLNFTGEGRRDVRVGYIQESPMWKTSYRLVLAEDKEPFLQGWAIVENTSEEDWKNVNLTLVSGRPISFIMDLYQPLYVPRPLVEPELFASLRPQTYGQDLAEAEEAFRDLAKYDDLKRKSNFAIAPPAPEAKRAQGRAKDRDYDPGFDLQRGVQSLAQAGEVGELFQYEIETPVTLPRQQSAMLPIVNGAVEGEKLSIYNPDVQAKHPLAGLRLKNTTGLHLMQGPITVFDDGIYAGDAQIQSLPPGTERLVSYALDLNTEVAIDKQTSSDVMSLVRITRGVLYTSHEYRRSRQYTVKNSGRRTKKVLIEYPLDSTWTLVTPEKAEEKTRDLYRFAVNAEPGKPEKLTVSERRSGGEQVVLNNLSNGSIQIYLRGKSISGAIKSALTEVIRRKNELSEITAAKKRLTDQIAIIGQEQDRIRRNMVQLDRTGDLYARYVKKFGDQEDSIERHRADYAKLVDEEARLRKALDEFLINLNVE